MAKMLKILIVDDEEAYRETSKMLLEDAGYYVETASSGEEGLAIMESEYFPLVVTDIKMDGMTGIEFLQNIKTTYEKDVEVIMVTGYGSVETAVKTIKMGAFGYFIKSHSPEELLLEIEKAKKVIDLRRTIDMSSRNERKYLVTSKNANMEKMWELVNMVAITNANVLITGESGVGKEIVAQKIHEISDRQNDSFMAINCQSFPDNLIESELFGHEKGAFTGATTKRLGKLEEASGGTVFLDEIGEMQKETQIKLLRVLENREIERVGSNKKIKVDFRLVSATNRDLSAAEQAGKFRRDFLYRINTVEIRIPPLRERKEDLPDLIELFVNNVSKDMGKKIDSIEENTYRFLIEYNYPGNVRELKNIIERLIIFSKDGVLKMEEEVYVAGGNTVQVQNELPQRDMPYKEAKENFEKQYITSILKRCDNNITAAAKIMDISRRQLFNKITNLNIEKGN
ncbi:MAG: sigma-54 dependent transcriptional regulator [Anaerovoracaceae bacterium]